MQHNNFCIFMYWGSYLILTSIKQKIELSFVFLFILSMIFVDFIVILMKLWCKVWVDVRYHFDRNKHFYFVFACHKQESTVRSSSIKSFSSQVSIKVFNSSTLICCSCTLFSVSASSSSISVKKIGSRLFRSKSGFKSASSWLSPEGIFVSVSRISMLPS